MSKNMFEKIVVVIVIIIMSSTSCTNEMSKETNDLSPEEIVELYFTYWSDKNESNMDSLVKESKRSADFDLQNLNFVTLESCVKREDKGGWNDAWFDNPYDYVCVDVSFSVEYKSGFGGGFDNGTYKWQYYLVKETKDSDWIIVMWGSG